MAFDFYQEIHRTQIFPQILQQADSLGTVCHKAVIFQRFGSIFIQIGISEVHEIIFKSYRVVCRLGEVEVLLDLHECFELMLDLHRCFEHSLVI